MTDGAGRQGPEQGQSYWVATAREHADFPPLSGDMEVDVAIIGAGMAGLTAAVILKQRGQRVAVLEGGKVGRQVTGRSTAKVTSQHSLAYHRLVRDFGVGGARAYAEANQNAVAKIGGMVRGFDIDCDFAPAQAYVYARAERHVAQLKTEVEAAQQVGLPASFTKDTDLPFAVAGAMRFDDQARFNPCAYLVGLARNALGEGVVFENTRARSVSHGEPCRVETDHGTVTAREVIVATHMPVIPEGLFFAKAFPHSHPVVAARVAADRAPEGMYISVDQPTHSVRSAPGSDGTTYLVATGHRYKPGHPEKQEEAFADVENFLRESFGVVSIDYRWTNMDYDSMDGVPFIGRATSATPHLYVATGFNAWGLTTGHVAGEIFADLAIGRPNPWTDLFDATRVKPVAGGPKFVTENLSAARHLIGDRFLRSRPKSVDAVAPGEAKVIEHEGEKIAVHRDETGAVHAVSAICTHMGCVLGWNPVDRTWDCPCHGSRFERDGAVRHGPATKDLEPKALEPEALGAKTLPGA
jgi:glycine/D-amino acid oxidase-like deaminating enzyme/nitrite reductase/ring-hydroxylating ferredoxin subunit